LNVRFKIELVNTFAIILACVLLKKIIEIYSFKYFSIKTSKFNGL